MVGGQTQMQSEKRDGGEAQAPEAEQRDTLRGFLRSLDFAAGAAALSPGEAGGGAGEGAAGPTVPPDKLKRLKGLVPQALAEVGAAQGAPEPEAERAAAEAPAAEAKKDDPKEKEAAEAAEAEAAVPADDSEGDEPVVAEVEEHDAHDEADAAEAEEHEAEEHGAGVQMKAKAKPKPKPAAHKPAAHKPAAHAPAHHAAAPKPKPKAKAKAKAAVKASGQKAAAPKAGAPSISQDPSKPLFPAAQKRALQWTRRHKFASNPFLVKRYQHVMGEPESGAITADFVQAVARFQLRHNKVVNGKLGGKTATFMGFLLRKRYGLDRKGLMTRHEVRSARDTNQQAIKTKHLSWKTVGDMRELLGLPRKGGLNAAFLRGVSGFQRQYGLREGATLNKGTVTKMRAELSDWRDEIYAAAKAYAGTSTADGPGGGNVACAWAVNHVLKNAIGHAIGSNTNLVDSVEAGLRREGKQVSRGKAQAGDVACIGHGAHAHIGIVMGGGSILSNSSSKASFSWWSDMSFSGGSYPGGSRFYRVMRGKG
ncbi:MAG: hypothetical protein KC635_23180 [Myxococcales bacterium]|nr:hypothetical protein [Myxococcales bacterium]MCB9737122.1 hypothetical protein [Deltaproteobacteria bacterium]